MARAPALALLAALCLADPEPSGRMIEVGATIRQSGSDGVLIRERGAPAIVCPEGQEGKLFIGRYLPGGEPDLDAVRVEFTPRVLDDGRIEIKVVSLGTELGERPGSPAAPPPVTTGKSGLTFHSALPAEQLFSLADKRGARRWLRIGQSVDGWTLAAYDPERRLLRLTRGGESVALALTKPSLTEPPPTGPRIERLRLLPGEPAEILGRDGHRMVVTARIFEGEPPAR